MTSVISKDGHITEVYFPPSTKPKELEEEIRKMIVQETGTQAIIRDFNAYNGVWGGTDSKTNLKDRTLVDILEFIQLKLCQRAMKGI